jgi:hypothetical protein
MSKNFLKIEDYSDYYKDDFEPESDSLSLLESGKQHLSRNVIAQTYTGRNSILRPIMSNNRPEIKKTPSQTGGRKLIGRKMLNKLNMIRDTLEFINVSTSRKS